MPYKEKIPGVYCLKAVNSKLIYIGSSQDIKHRKIMHLYNIRRNITNHGCKAIIDAVRLDNDIIEFSIIEQCENYLEQEQYWIDFYRNQKVFTLVNTFDADRVNSIVPQSFKDKMSDIRKEKWKDEEYRNTTLDRLKATEFTAERLNKLVFCFDLSGRPIKAFKSAKEAAWYFNYSAISVSSTARGSYRGKFKYKDKIFIYGVRVLDKLDELLETHQELRAISSEVWETCIKYQKRSTTNQ